MRVYGCIPITYFEEDIDVEPEITKEGVNLGPKKDVDIFQIFDKAVEKKEATSSVEDILGTSLYKEYLKKFKGKFGPENEKENKCFSNWYESHLKFRQAIIFLRNSVENYNQSFGDYKKIVLMLHVFSMADQCLMRLKQQYGFDETGEIMEKYCSEDHKIANLILVFMKEYRGDLEKDSFQYKGKTAGFSVKEQWFDNNDALNRSRKYVKTFLGKYPTYKGKYGDKDPSSWINAIKITVLRYIGICLESNKVIKKVSFSPGYFAKDVSDLMTLWMLQNLGDNNYRICPVCGNFFRVGPQPGQIYCGRHTRSQIYYFQKKKREAGK